MLGVYECRKLSHALHMLTHKRSVRYLAGRSHEITLFVENILFTARFFYPHLSFFTRQFLQPIEHSSVCIWG